MRDLTEFQRGATAVAVKQMLGGTHFSVCDVDAIGKLIGVNPEQDPDYRALRVLHCVHWSDMGPVLAQQTRDAALRVLKLNNDVVDVLATEKKPAPQPKLSWLDRSFR